MGGSDPARTKGKGLDCKQVARVDYDRSEVSRKSYRGYFFVAAPSAREIRERAEGAPDLCCSPFDVERENREFHDP